ncbi:MAG: endonuclease III [Anaerolineae bacterium]|nr:endonuclease III [Anaerolineae bacterium]
MSEKSALAAKALRIHQLLLNYYGEPQLKPQRDPLSELIMTILSQNTADVNSHRAYQNLRQRFPRWEDLLTADIEKIAEAIHIGGLANVKARRIQAILRQLYEEHGNLDLRFLADLPLEEARRYLLSLAGVGPKTAACVLLFSLQRPVLPVDTHVHRVARRLGLIPPKASREKAHLLLEELLPPETYYPFHLNMIRHGRTLCKAGQPQCARCPLAPECDFLNLSQTAAPATGVSRISRPSSQSHPT